MDGAIKLLFILLLAVMLFACAEPQVSHEQMKLDQLYQADPKIDAQKAIANDDLRFIAVMNHKLIMPLNINTCIVDQFGYRTLSNQTFKYMSYLFQQYGAISQTYANWYNYEVLAHIEEHFPEKFACQVQM